MGGKYVNYGVLEQLFGKKILTIQATWVENTVNYGVLEHFAWHKFTCFGRKLMKHRLLQCFFKA